MSGLGKVGVMAGALVVVSASIPVPSRLAAMRVKPQTQPPIVTQIPPVDVAPVRPAPIGERLGANPGQKGATYYALESQAVRLTAHYADAVAVTERTFDGDVHTTLSDKSGNELARLKFDRIDGVNDIVHYAPRVGRPLQAFSRPTVKPTLDWNSHQAYQLWKDQIDSDSSSVEWRGDVIRRRGGVRREVQKELVELQTDWASGMTSRTVRRSVSNLRLLPGRVLNGEVLVTRLIRDGAEVGIVNWFPDSQVLVWNLPGLTKGYLAPEHLKEHGGWPFTPDMTWLNMQTTAFHQFKTQIDKNRFVASRQPGWSDRVLQFFAPTVNADEPGCDGLHWLDGTMLRYCCDVHDICYSANGCTSKSWWMIWTSWKCDFCNMWVVDCFMNGGVEWNDRGMPK